MPRHYFINEKFFNGTQGVEIFFFQGDSYFEIIGRHQGNARKLAKLPTLMCCNVEKWSLFCNQQQRC